MSPAKWGTSEATELAGTVTVERRGQKRDFDATRTAAPEVAGLRGQLVVPGDLVTSEPGTLRGHGLVEREDGKLTATTCGVVEHVNKLLYVRQLKNRYKGNVGDVVVGRVVEVQTERWSVEIGTATLAYLHIGAVNLPGNVQRRRTDEDCMKMRELFVENDIISAEVQKVGESGEVALQTRNARYGKLQNGSLVNVTSVYVRRQAQHLLTLPQIGVQVILGSNGWIWVCAPPKVAGSGRQETLNFSQMDVRYAEVNADLRERICRIRNTVLALAAHGLEITPESITFAFESSLERGLSPWELSDPSRCAGLIEDVISDAVAASRGRSGGAD